MPTKTIKDYFKEPMVSIIYGLILQADIHDIKIKKMHLKYFLVKDYPETVTSQTLHRNMLQFWEEYGKKTDTPSIVEFFPDVKAKEEYSLDYTLKTMIKKELILKVDDSKGQPYYRISIDGIAEWQKGFILRRMEDYIAIIEQFDEKQIEQLYVKIPTLIKNMDKIINSIK